MTKGCETDPRWAVWRRAWAGFAWVVLGAAGVVGNLTLVVSFVVAASMVGILGAALVVSTPSGTPDWRQAVSWGVSTSAGVVALGCLASLDVGLALLLVVAALLSSPGVRRGRRHSLARLPSGSVRDLRTSELCRAWQDSLVTLDRACSPGERSLVVARRQLYLDEIARREPDGFSAWMSSGAAADEDPGQFLRSA